MQRRYSPPESSDVVSGKYAVWAVTAAALAWAIAWGFFSELNISLDTVGLFNPIYMYLHYGKMTYPTYLFFHSMVVHPPTHYLAVALLMKAGVPFQYAVSISSFLLILLTILAITTGRFSNSIKISLLCGLLIGVLQIQAIDLRPDLDMALAWFAGLVALEAGRLQEWDPKRLFCGAFLITCASGTHYTGSFAWLGALVYVVWCVWQLNWRHARKPILSVIAGGCLFGVPYLILFVIPHWTEINSFVHSTQATGTILSSIHSHIEMYRFLYPDRTTFLCRTVFFAVCAGIPVIVIAFPVLFAIRQLRGMALASLPQLLFFLLLVHRKFPVPGYFVPEFILYSCAICVVLTQILLWVERFLDQRSRLALPVSGVVLVWAILRITPWMQRTHLRFRIDALGVARAAGRKILGPHALVGARLARFYTNGGAYSYMIEPDLLWRNFGDLDLKSYFANFDAIAEDPFMSDATVNEQKESLTSWYADGTLQLRGFFFSNPQERWSRVLKIPNGFSYLLLSASKGEVIKGYGLQTDNQLAEFREEAHGDHVFVTAICDSQFRLDDTITGFSELFLLPRQEHDAMQRGMLAFVVENRDFQKLQPLLSRRCSIRDQRIMKKTLVSTQTLLATLNQDQNISFYSTLADALNARYGPEIRVEFDASSWPSAMTFLRSPMKGESHNLSGAGTLQLFRSDMDSTDGWWASPQKKVQGLEIVASGLKAGERSGDFKTDKWGGYVVSEYKSTPGDRSSLYFFAWVKAVKGEDIPKLSLQDEAYNAIGTAGVITQVNDGWTLLGGWVRPPTAPKVRLLIEQEKNTESLVDKVLLVAISGNLSGTAGLKNDQGDRIQKRGDTRTVKPCWEPRNRKQSF